MVTLCPLLAETASAEYAIAAMYASGSAMTLSISCATTRLPRPAVVKPMETFSAVWTLTVSGVEGPATRSIVPHRSENRSSRFDDGYGLTLLHHLSLFDADLRHRAGDGRGDGDLHLHRLEDHQRVVLLDALPDVDDDLPEIAHQLGLDLDHRLTPLQMDSYRRNAVLAPGAALALRCRAFQRVDDDAACVGRVDDVVHHRP